MKQLFEEFVEEMRLAVRDKFGPQIISKEDFAEILYQGNISPTTDKDEITEDERKVVDLLMTAYGTECAQKLIETFYYSDEMDKEVFEDFYDFTCNLSPKWAYDCKVIGSGVEGIVFDLGKYVAKFFFKTMNNKTQMITKHWRNKKYKTLPHVLRIDPKNKWYVMEHLDITENSRWYSQQFLEEIDQFGRYNGEDEDFYKWYRLFLKEAEECEFDKLFSTGFKFKINEKLDCHKGNFAERENGDIVFFDPYFSEHYIE